MHDLRAHWTIPSASTRPAVAPPANAAARAARVVHAPRQRPTAIQPSRGFIAGVAGGATLGFAVAGPAGALGGAIVGGGVLGPAIGWWYGIPTRFEPDPAELRNAKQNLRATGGPVPYAAPTSPADQMLAAGRQRLRPAPPLALYSPPPSRADQMLAAGKQRLKPAPPLVSHAPPHPGALRAARQNLVAAQAPVAAPLAQSLPQGWGLNQPEVVPLSEQQRGKRLDQMILPKTAATVTTLYRGIGNQLLTGDTVLRAGVHQISSRFVANGHQGPVVLTTLHVKPSIAELMTAMGFASRGWRWELSWGTHGTLHNDFHVTVPKDLQSMPDRMDNPGNILNGLFPLGNGMTGTHMTIECRQTAGMSNAAAFLNGSKKYPQGFSQGEGQQFVNACASRLTVWKNQRLASLTAALSTL